MLWDNEKSAVWFWSTETTAFFYPFGVSGAGYLVAQDRANRVSRWTYWRSQLPLILWTLGFVPLVVFWAPSLAESQKLEAPNCAIALALLTVIAATGGWMGNRAVYAGLLRGCPVMNRVPSRAERKSATRQFGASRRNFIYLPLPVAFLGLATCATTMFVGAVREDIPMWAIGALVSPLFWYAFIKEGVDQALLWITARHWG
jgi:hypothetical protein